MQARHDRQCTTSKFADIITPRTLKFHTGYSSSCTLQVSLPAVLVLSEHQLSCTEVHQVPLTTFRDELVLVAYGPQHMRPVSLYHSAARAHSTRHMHWLQTLSVRALHTSTGNALPAILLTVLTLLQCTSKERKVPQHNDQAHSYCSLAHSHL